MKISRSTALFFFIVLLIVGINIYTSDSLRVENQYSRGFFPSFASGYRIVTGDIPFSVGDIIYGCFIAWILYKLFRFIFISGSRWRRLGKAALLFGCIYIVFSLFWGINYNRLGIAHQLNIEPGKYTKEDLIDLNCSLLDKLNESRMLIAHDRKNYLSPKEILKRVSLAYKKVESEFPFLKYKNPSLKSSVWGWLGNYVGFTGYYNPFTAEAQVNTNVPSFIVPYTACHEVAHQLGYAKENEANFVGYLAASSFDDPYFHYSTYFDLFLYANRKMQTVDSSAAKLYRKDLNILVKADIQEWIEFNKKHSTPIEPLIWWAYGKFLEQNRQPQGIKSYDEVISLLIAYKKKTGKI